MIPAAPHFGIQCPCGKLVAFPIPPSRKDDDPVEILRYLPAKQQGEILDFWNAHESHGNLLPCVVEITPTGQA